MIVPPSHKGRILVVDNDPDRLDSTQILLESRGYRVFTANTLAKAEEIVAQECPHLALLDVRMEADSDSSDTSGLDFAARLDPVIAKVILTAYPTVEMVKEALRPYTRMTAVDFIIKQEGPAALLAGVERAFQERVKINFQLKTHWQEGLTPEKVAEDIKIEDYSPCVVTNEVEEILGKLFYAMDEIAVSPLILYGRPSLSSQSGAVLLKVEPIYREGGRGASVVVKLAARQMASQEADNYQRFVGGFIGDFRRTNLDRFAETYLLGGLVYTLVGTSLEQTMDLGSFYAGHDADQIIGTLEHLLSQTCHLWYENRKDRQVVNLTRSYQEALHLSWSKVEAVLRAENLQEVISPSALQFPGLEATFVNPLRWAEEQSDWVMAVHICVTHGDLHSRNILIDERGQAWLIDFYRTGHGHILRDLIELETDVKFDLLEATDISTLFEFETALLTQHRLGDGLPPLDFSAHPKLEKAFAVVAGLRRIASHLLGDDMEMTEYYQALFLLTMNILRLKSIDRPKKQHALLSAALIAQRLEACLSNVGR